MPTVRTILPQNTNEVPILRVAAYCRVSTDSEDQQHSLGAQTEYYTKLIGENPLWTLADIYADEGISGTSVKHRDEFNRMIEDCKRGKVDRVLTKSVSRFARNTVDCLENVRLLSSLGISILFEKEQIDTAKMSSEVILAFMSAQAQDESTSISGNLRWSYEKRMKNGSFVGCGSPFGYRLVNGGLVIHEEEAEIVRWIFSQFLSGRGLGSIAKELNAKGVSTRNYAGFWHHCTVRYILRNERYVGDALLQKTLTTDTFPRVHRVNKGEQTKYYVENNHPPIISREEFQAVQAIMKGNPAGKKQPRGKYTGLIKCAYCGSSFTKAKSGCWTCAKKSRGRSDCPSVWIEEGDLDLAVDRAFRTLSENPEIITQTVKYLERLQESKTGSRQKVREIDRSIAETTSQLSVLTQLQTQGILDAADFVEQNRSLSERISRLRSERRMILQSSEDGAIDSLSELQESLEDIRSEILEGESDSLRAVVKRVVVNDAANIEIHLLGDLIIPEQLPDRKKRCQKQ